MTSSLNFESQQQLLLQPAT